MSRRTPSKTVGKERLSRRARTAQSSVKSDAAALTPLNFKVPREFHREFKTFAAQHSKKMVEVLQEAFALLKGANDA
jgi:hypothetical protein